LSEAEAVAFVDRKQQSNINPLLYEVARVLRHGRDQSEGRGPMDRLVWDIVEIGIQPDPTLAGGSRRRIGLDFQPISQPWLRALALAWARHQSDPDVMADTVRVAVEVSHVLDQRHDKGNRIARLTDRDAELIAQAFNRLKTPKGRLMTVKHQRHLHRRFFELIAWGRDNGHLDELPRSFAPRPTHLRPFETDPEDEVGKAIPVGIQRELDAHIDSIGRAIASYGQLSDDDIHLMFRTAYIILRDTGRRPLEVAALGLNCLAHDTSGTFLIWDNHKSKRHGRRLPIVRSTADAIQRWIDRRIQLPVPVSSTAYLFPAVAERAREPYLRTVNLNRAIRLWVDGLERLDTNDVGDLGNPIPFDRALVYPYAFRHSYAQRHADNGTPIDVLRDLMDHRTMETTGRYYKITATRKRDAVDTVGKYTIDRDGNDAPLTESTSYQMRSVAVPFGNCIEPTNVKAGGHACPVRFQCAGCGFYRPDPSFIPAIEEHLNTLRSDREIARAINAAPFVADNLTAQIDSFNRVLTVMRDRLETLDPDEREHIEEAAAVLRRARAGAVLPLTVVNHAQQ
jgi:integrase